MNRTFRVSGILLWQENVNLTLSGHEAALGADTFLGAPLQTELPARGLQRDAGPGWPVYTIRACPPRRQHVPNNALLIKSKVSVVFNLDSIQQVDHTTMLVSTQTYEMSVYIVTVFIFIMLILAPKGDCNL